MTKNQCPWKVVIMVKKTVSEVRTVTSVDPLDKYVFLFLLTSVLSHYDLNAEVQMIQIVNLSFFHTSFALPFGKSDSKMTET